MGTLCVLWSMALERRCVCRWCARSRSTRRSWDPSSSTHTETSSSRGQDFPSSFLLFPPLSSSFLLFPPLLFPPLSSSFLLFPPLSSSFLLFPPLSSSFLLFPP